MLRSRNFTRLLLALLVILAVAINIVDAQQTATDDKSIQSNPNARIERKTRKLSLSDKKEHRFDELARQKLNQAKSSHAKLKSVREERMKKAKRESDKQRKKMEDEMRKNIELDNPEMKHEALNKITQLVTLTSKSSSRVISLDDAQYRELILDGNRPYYVMLTFTALSPDARCAMCHEFNRAVIPVAQQYYDDVLSKNDAESLMTSRNAPIFFVNIDIAKNRAIFDAMQLNTAPAPIMLTPRMTAKPMKINTVLKSTPAKNQFPLQQRLHTQDVVTFVQKVTNQMINVNYNAVNGEEIIIAILALATGLFVVYRYFDAIISLRTSSSLRLFMCIAGWMLYMWCISGGMYNIIKGNIFAQTEKDKPTQYISSEPRDQYGAEGLILGALNILAASSLLLVSTRAFDDSKVGSQLGSFSTLTRGTAKQIWSVISPVLRPELCIALMTAFWFYIVSIYSWKNRGYRMGFVWSP